MKKIVVTNSRKYLKYPDLISAVEKRNGIFIDGFITDLNKVKELYDDDEKVLMLDELNIEGDFKAVNKNLHKFENVKYICSLSSRYHEYDLEKSSKNHIKYCNNPDTTSQSVAELALMHLLVLIRKQPLYKNDNFDFFGMNNLGKEMGSLSAGILGFGNIGGRVAKLLSDLGMDVKIWSRTKKNTKYSQVNFAELLKKDVIVISIVSGKESKKLFNNNFYNSLDKSKYVIDIVADDSLYDKNKIIRMCNEGNLAGFGFEIESPRSEYIDIKGNISTSPHVAWGTEESYRRLMEGWVNTVIMAYDGKPINVIK